MANNQDYKQTTAKHPTTNQYVANRKGKIALGGGKSVEVSPGDVWNVSDPYDGQAGKSVLVMPMGNKSRFVISPETLNRYFRKEKQGSESLNNDRRDERGTNRQFTTGGRRTPDEINNANSKGKNMSKDSEKSKQQNEENETVVNENELRGTDRYTTSGLKKTIETLKKSKNPKAAGLLAKTQKLLDTKTAKAGNPVGTRKEKYASDARRASSRAMQGSASSNNKASDDENENRNKEVSSGVRRDDGDDKKPQKSNEPSVRQRAHAATKGMKVGMKNTRSAMKIGMQTNSVEVENEKQIDESISAYDYAAAAMDGNVVNFTQNVNNDLNRRAYDLLNAAKEAIVGNNQNNEGESSEENTQSDNSVSEENSEELKNDLIEAIASMEEEELDAYFESLNDEEFEQLESILGDVYNPSSEDGEEENE